MTQGRSDSTVRTYVYNVSLFLRWCAGARLNPTELTSIDIARWFISQAKRSRSTAVSRLMAVRSYCRFLVAAGELEADPTVGISAHRPRVEAREPYSMDELHRLLAAADLREQSILLFAVGSACRRSEIFGLRLEDIDRSSGLVLIRQGKGAKQRRVAPGSRSLAVLKRYAQGRTSGVIWSTAFGKPLSGYGAYKLLRELADRANVPGATFHRFRVTAATWFMEKGMALDELQEVLGHADIGTTAHYAAHNRRDRALRRQHKLSLANRLVA